MTLQQLGDQETELCLKTIELANQPQTQETRNTLEEICIEYKKIHQVYADLSFIEIEALKRGLFIQWYALSTAYWLSGIAELNNESKNKVLNTLYQYIDLKKFDKELIWMLNYYYTEWRWVFESWETFGGFDIAIVNDQNNELPHIIDREAMKLRGQMGRYWNSLNVFNKP